jgi:Protein of unknown function (DUF3489)
MADEHKSPKSARPAVRLSDTQLVLLSAAAQRDDHCLTAAPNLKGRAAHKVAEKLIAAGLAREIKAKSGAPVWRRDEETALSFALKLTAAGLKAIAVDETEEEPAEPAHTGAETQHKGAPVKDLADQGFNKTLLKRGKDVEGGSRNPRGGAEPSAPRSGSKTAEIIDLLRRDHGATLDELIAATGWLPHTTRAALTGLRKRGYEIGRSRSDGVTRYKIEGADRGLNDPNDLKDGGASASLRDERAA